MAPFHSDGGFSCSVIPWNGTRPFSKNEYSGKIRNTPVWPNRPDEVERVANRTLPLANNSSLSHLVPALGTTARRGMAASSEHGGLLRAASSEHGGLLRAASRRRPPLRRPPSPCCYGRGGCDLALSSSDGRTAKAAPDGHGGARGGHDGARGGAGRPRRSKGRLRGQDAGRR